MVFIPCTFHLPLIFPLTITTENAPCNVHFSDSVPVLLVSLVFAYLGSIDDNCEFVLILLFIVLIFFGPYFFL